MSQSIRYSPDSGAYAVERRGAHLGYLTAQVAPSDVAMGDEMRHRWAAAESISLPGILRDALRPHSDDFARAHALYEAVLDGESCESRLIDASYYDRINPEFDMLSSSYDEADGQQIERVDFDVLENGEATGDEIWMKASWLSFDEEDASLRFRFSFGIDGYDDVSTDFSREKHAARLAELVFPESALIASNAALLNAVKQASGAQGLAFVERIVYFNAPNGGAQFHQDVEGAHLGIVFAQLTGRTAWLTLPKAKLAAEIAVFLARPDAKPILSSAGVKPAWWKTLNAMAQHSQRIAEALDNPENPGLEILINRTPEFFAQLVEFGAARILEPGDALLLPQRDMQHCNWHSVFCLGDESGEALSFALREAP